jgi:hypothetical protein
MKLFLFALSGPKLQTLGFLHYNGQRFTDGKLLYVNGERQNIILPSDTQLKLTPKTARFTQSRSESTLTANLRLVDDVVDTFRGPWKDSVTASLQGRFCLQVVEGKPDDITALLRGRASALERHLAA